MSESLFKDYLSEAGLNINTNYPDTFQQMTIWRCMNNKVYACDFGANIPCDANANTDFCQANQNVDFIPMSGTGHNVIYCWHWDNGNPEILDQINTVDVARYHSSF